MTARVEIRDARPTELATAAAVMLAAYAQYQPLMPPAVWEDYAREIGDVWSRLDESELIVAVVEDTIQGAVTFFPEAGRLIREGWPAGWAAFRLLAVHPRARGLGLGRRLTEECIRRARARGSPVLGLHTTEWMAVARAMYERMGFVRAPEYDFDLGEGVRIEAYRLDLHPPSAGTQGPA